MRVEDYNTMVKKLTWLYLFVFFLVVIPGFAVSLYLVEPVTDFVMDRLAGSQSSWTINMFPVILPMFLATITIGLVLVRLADRRFGLKCPCCGKSLILGQSIRRCLRNGDACPSCGVVVVKEAMNAEPGTASNDRPAAPLENPKHTERPPSVS